MNKDCLKLTTYSAGSASGTRPSSPERPAPAAAPLGTETHLSAQIGEKRTQFARIEPLPLGRVNLLNCRYFAAVREISAHD